MLHMNAFICVLHIVNTFMHFQHIHFYIFQGAYILV